MVMDTGKRIHEIHSDYLNSTDLKKKKKNSTAIVVLVLGALWIGVYLFGVEEGDELIAILIPAIIFLPLGWVAIHSQNKEYKAKESEKLIYEDGVLFSSNKNSNKLIVDQQYFRYQNNYINKSAISTDIKFYNKQTKLIEAEFRFVNIIEQDIVRLTSFLMELGMSPGYDIVDRGF